MLASLRRKFVIITTALVAVVLAGVLAGSVVGARMESVDQLRRSMEMALYRADNMQMPAFEMGKKPDGPGGQEDMPRVPVYVFEVMNGAVSQNNNDWFYLDESLMQRIAAQVQASSTDEGSLATEHLMWRRLATDTGWRVAVCDTTSADALFTSQLVQSVGIFVAGTAIVALISVGLARWALAPVEQSWEQQKRFVADASHELKTPLSVILANSQILEDHESQIPQEDMRWILSTREEAESMKALVDDLLDLARTDDALEGDKAARNMESLDFSEMVSRIALQFDAIAFERNCSIETDIEKGVQVQGDPSTLDRLVSILVDNACKYAREGSAVDVVLQKKNGRAVLSVHNAGDPIPAQDLPHVFERFYRSDAARTKDGVGGYGLGLAIAKGIADAHNASLEVASTAQDGTTFTLGF